MADSLATGSGFTKSLTKAEPFVLTAYSKLKSPGKSLTVYIEGDGLAMLSESHVSGDPTPQKPMVFLLATMDASANVIYLARPCQYTPVELNVACRDSDYWTDKRFSEEVIHAMNEAVDYFAEESQAKEIHLVGYSGGAAVALLLAERRIDVKSLRTIAGNLDPWALNRYHHFSEFSGSLDPLAQVQKISAVPQIHFVGDKDEVVPPFIAEDFVKKIGSDCAKVIRVPNTSHHEGWLEKWPDLLKEVAGC